MISISVARGFWYLIHVSNFRGLSMFELLLFKLTVTTKPKFFFLNFFSFPHQIRLDWSIITEWQTDGWSDQLTYGPTDWLTDWVQDCLQFNWPTDWMTDWLTIQLTGWLTEEKMNKWIDGLMDEQADFLSIWETDLLTDWLTYWQTY